MALLAALLSPAAPAAADVPPATRDDATGEADGDAEPNRTQGGTPEGTSDEAIVVLGTRRVRADATLSSDAATKTMSAASRAIERDMLDAAGVYRLADALELVSNVSNQNNRGGMIDNFAIRGFLGTPDGGAEYYVDGFLANRGMAPPRDPATTERIEAVKGPAGALFGDIDPAGRVNIVSKTPAFAPAAAAVLTAGSFGTRRVTLDATGPLSTTLAARIVVAAEDSDGWRDFVGLSRRVVAPSLTWRPHDGVRLTYVGEITRFDSLFDRGVPAIHGDANALPRSRYLGEPADGMTRFRNVRHQLTGDVSVAPDWAIRGGLARRTGTLRGFSSDSARLVGDRSLWRQRRSRDFAVEDWSARLEIAGSIGAHRPSVGIKGYHLDYAERWMRRNPNAAAPYAIDVFEPVYGQTPPVLLPFTNNREKRWSGTLYVQDVWSVTDRLTLSAGVRLDGYRQQIMSLVSGAVGGAAGTPATMRAGLRYQLTGAIAAHGNWGENLVLNSGTDRLGQGFAPETGRGHELGLEGTWRGVDVALTWFDIGKRGILTNDPVDSNFLAPVGRLTSRGIEADAAVRLGRRWQVVGNYAWTAARMDDSSFPTDRALNVPAHSGTLLVVGRFVDAGGRGPSVSGGVTYVGARAGSIERDVVILPAYAKAKAMLDYAFGPQLGVRLEADNLFDAHYAQSSYSRVWIFPGQPRTLRLALRIGA